MIPKLQHACGSDPLRPAFQYIVFDEQPINGRLWATATDGHLLIRWNANHEWDNETTQHLAGKMVHKQIWAEITRPRTKKDPHPAVEFHPDAIHLQRPYPHRVMLGSKFFATHAEFEAAQNRGFGIPIYRRVIGSNGEGQGVITVNVRLLAKLAKLFPGHQTGKIELKMGAPNKPIQGIVSCDDYDAWVMLMPLLGRDNPDEIISDFSKFIEEHSLESTPPTP